MRILLAGMVAGVPGQGGAAWAVLQYLLGLRRLGHEVLLVEQCAQEDLRPAGASLEDSENASYFRAVASELGSETSAALLLAGSERTAGLPYGQVRERARGADLLINISGLLTDEALVGEIPVRLYLDLDPAFNQIWHTTGIDMRFDGHTHFATVGQAIGSAECPVPSCGLEWIGTLPPVSLEHWPPEAPITCDAFTTVGHWRAYGAIEFDGVHYGQRAHSMRELITLPTLTDADFVLALSIHPDEQRDIAALAENGWRLLDPAEVTPTPSAYREFVQGSAAELGVPKSGYVVSRSGWFSDRSACYLASGRPVVAQDTGFSRFLPTGEGLLAFETVEQALAAVEEVRRDHARHGRAARALAQEHLDSDKVLTTLLEKL